MELLATEVMPRLTHLTGNWFPALHSANPETPIHIYRKHPNTTPCSYCRCVESEKEWAQRMARKRAARGHQGPNHWHVERRSSVIVCRPCGERIPAYLRPQQCPNCGAGAWANSVEPLHPAASMKTTEGTRGDLVAYIAAVLVSILLDMDGAPW